VIESSEQKIESGGPNSGLFHSLFFLNRTLLSFEVTEGVGGGVADVPEAVDFGGQRAAGGPDISVAGAVDRQTARH
jgi:hypothetical protein